MRLFLLLFLWVFFSEEVQALLEFRKGISEEKVRSRLKRICVFCGSSSGKKPSYQEAAIELGKELYTGLHPGGEQNVVFKIYGYQWCTLRFTEDTHQRTTKIMLAYKESDPGSLFLRQEAHCLGVPSKPETVTTPMPRGI